MAVPVMMLMAAEEEAFVIFNYTNYMLGILVNVFLCLFVLGDPMPGALLVGFSFFFRRPLAYEPEPMSIVLVALRRRSGLIGSGLISTRSYP